MIIVIKNNDNRNNRNRKRFVVDSFSNIHLKHQNQLFQDVLLVKNSNIKYINNGISQIIYFVNVFDSIALLDSCNFSLCSLSQKKNHDICENSNHNKINIITHVNLANNK